MKATLTQDRGSTSVEMLVLLPLLLAVLWMGLSAALYFYGRTAALAAAQTGAAAAAAQHGTGSDCQRAATQLAAKLGDSLRSVTIQCSRGATLATATVSGSTLSLLPGWFPTVTMTATVPVERVT